MVIPDFFFFKFKHKKSLQKGYIFWAETVNNKTGGINVNGTYYQVQLYGTDDEAAGANVASIYQSLITQVDFLLGPCKKKILKEFLNSQKKKKKMEQV